MVALFWLFTLTETVIRHVCLCLCTFILVHKLVSVFECQPFQQSHSFIRPIARVPLEVHSCGCDWVCDGVIILCCLGLGVGVCG